MSAAWDMENGAALVPAETLVRRRRAGVRARTTSMERLSKRRLAAWGAEADAMLAELVPEAIERPRTRHECLQGDNAERPCPFVSCEYHLYLDVDEEHGSIKENFPDLEVWEMTETCALDVAERGGATLEEVGAITNLTRERIRQLEGRALTRVRPVAAQALRDYVEPLSVAEASPSEPEHDELREPAQTADVLAELAELQVPLGGSGARFDAPSWGSR